MWEHDNSEDTGIYIMRCYTRASLVAQKVKRLPAMQEAWVQSLGQEDPLEPTRSFQLLQNAAAACFLKDPSQMDHINVHALQLVLATRVFLEAVQRVAFDL